MKLRLQAGGSDLFVFVEGNAAPKLRVTREGARILTELCCVAELRAAIGHYAEHGTLPPEAPVWPKMTVVADGNDCWTILRANGFKAASVSRLGAEWKCVDSDGRMSAGATPQAAVDAARTWLADRWGLTP